MLALSISLASGQQHPSVWDPLGWMTQQQPVLSSALRQGQSDDAELPAARCGWNRAH